MFFVDMLVIGRVKADLMDLHQRIDRAGKAGQRVCLKNNL